MALYAASDLLVGRVDTEKERQAPRHPTPVSFPDITSLTTLNPQPWTKETCPNFFDLRLRWQYVQQIDHDLGPKLWQTFNIKFMPECTSEELLGETGRDFLPPKEWLEAPETREQGQETWCPNKLHHEQQATQPGCGCKLHNGRPWPTRRDFHDRFRDVSYSNRDAFQGHTRTNKDGKPPPRLTHGRPFVQYLDTLVQYWDASEDQYIPPKQAPRSVDGNTEDDDVNMSDEPRKRTKLESDGLDPLLQSKPETAAVPLVSIEQVNQRSRVALRRLGFHGDDPPAPPPGTYKGWRMECGSRMPNNARDSAVKAFLDLAIWPYGMHVDNQERMAPRLEVQALRITVPITRRVWQDPLSRLDARAGIMFGPALATSCRPVTGFSDNAFVGQLDLLRELGALLLVAQERSREGREEKRPGEGQWWYEKPRWGGLPYEVPGEYGVEDMQEPQAEPTEEAKPEGAEKRILGYAARKEQVKNRNRELLMNAKQRAIQTYKAFKPPLPNWDGKARYTQVGKERESDYDEAFLVSSLNHHISLVKFRVHKAYLAFLETGKFPEDASLPSNWSIPVVSRSRWFDLINPKDRAEAFCMIWALGGYLARIGSS